MTEPSAHDETDETDQTDETPRDATGEQPPHEPPRELPPPRYNPLYFGIVAATIQMAVLLWLLFG